MTVSEDEDDGREGWRLAVRGAELDRHGRTAEAEEVFHQAVALGDFNGMYNLGLLAERAGRTDDARGWYVRAHEAGHPEAANNLGVLLHNAGDPDALSWFSVAAAAGHPQAAANAELCRSAQSGRAATPTALKPLVLYAQAEAAYREFESSGNDAALVRAVNLNREAVALVPADHSLRGRMLAGLRDILRYRYNLRGHSADLDEAADVALTALSELPPDHAERRRAAQSAVALLRLQTGVTGNPDKVLSAVDIAGEALAQPGGTEQELGELESSLCGALVELASYDCDADVHLDKAVDWGWAAVGRMLPGDAVSRINLASALNMRGRRRGSPDDLDDAITLLRAAGVTNDRSDRAAVANEASHRAAVATTLASVLRTRAELTGRSEDEREARVAAEGAQTAVRAAPAHHPQTLVQAADAAEGPAALDAAKRAAAAVPPGHSARSGLLVRLAMALDAAGEQDDAIEAAREAAATAGSRSVAVDAGRVLGVLLLGIDEDDPRRRVAVTEAVDAFTTAAEACGTTDVLYAEVKNGQAAALIARFLRDAAGTDRKKALEALRAAARASGSPARERLLATRMWAGVAREAGDLVDALEGARAGVDLLQEVGWIGLEQTDREEGLRGGAAMPREAAALAIEAGQPELAVELLEQGRSVLWQSTLHLRGDLAALAAREPGLAAELEDVRSALNGGGDRPLDPEARMRLARRWTRMLAKVRELPGFTAFPTPATYDALVPAAAEGPVVIVNISKIRCDAILVLPGGRVDVVPLPGVNVPAMDTIANTYLRHLAEASATGATILPRERARHTVHDTLEWLWEHIARPVLDRLGLPSESADPPRLWWCPTASLLNLPLHAAGIYPRGAYDPTEPVGLPYAVVSSYTTTLAALVDARRRRAAPDSGVLAVGLSDVQAGHAPLPAVAEELRLLEELMGQQLNVLADEGATVDAVREQLPRHSWAHFACHGTLNMAAPATSGLCLWDGDMNVLDFADLRLDRAELAFLSACLTRLSGGLLPDEAIHTAAALRMAGFRHVVATLWSISDRVAPVVAVAFYRQLGPSGGMDSAGAAVALHRAVAGLRDQHLTDPIVWAPFVHDGP
ncbi:CHAT domain-containing protein [Streptomyces sp. ISL-94]|uniref:CHAT domain-containing protein n=1 Tax=Streptomyces sp. ISL-94 TaxID=2819190 RepID=UPI001BE94EE2|nr:CHAT domain-containing protein [Streptomyces sp. ISL-94]MBT2482965.1 CHAT domain-containing protein [Streptomyces sp. ISL-94]